MMKRISSLLLVICLLVSSQVTFANKFLEDNEVEMTNPLTNELGADLFISLHYNASTSTAPHGVEVLYEGDETRHSKLLAESIQPYLVKDLNELDRGIVHRPNLVVLRETHMPAVLCELGFISNEEELAKILSPDYNAKATEAIVKGVKAYLSK